jgi:ABC-type bacteriocin/lantibiotic exporter with double-glycine peptidase domain
VWQAKSGGGMNNVLRLFKDVFAMLNKREKGRLLLLLGLALLTMVLEIASVGVIVPLVGLFTNIEKSSTLPLIGRLTDQYSTSAVLVIVLSGVLGLFVVKNTVLLASTYIRNRVLTSLNSRLTSELFVRLLEQPYSFHLRTNSAELVQATQNISTVTSGSLVPALTILTDSIVGVGILALLVWAEPVGSLVTLGLFGGAGAWLVASTRSLVERWGLEAREAKTGVMRALMQGFGGVREIKILGRAPMFVQEHQRFLFKSLRPQRLYSTFSTVPRLLFEILAVLGVTVLVALLIAIDRPIEEILPVLALFTVGTFRILPSVTRTIESVQQIRFAGAMVDQAKQLMSLAPEVRGASSLRGQLRFDSIEVKNLTFSYGGDSMFRLGPLDFSVSRGEYVGLVGESGSGKSTIVDLISGLLIPDEGAILVNGHDVGRTKEAWQSVIGYVPQSIFLVDESIRKNVAFGIRDRDIDDLRVAEALEAAQLSEFVESLSEGVSTHVGERGVRLSGGQRQRIGIARALYHRPEVLLLDEATAALDMETERGVMNAIHKLRGSVTVIIVAHRLTTVERCDRVYRVEQGQIVASGGFADVVHSMQRK